MGSITPILLICLLPIMLALPTTNLDNVESLASKKEKALSKRSADTQSENHELNIRKLLGDVINSQADNRESWKRYVNSRPLLVKPTKRSPTDFMVTGSYFEKRNDRLLSNDKESTDKLALLLKKLTERVDELKKSGYGTTSQPLSLTTASLAESIAKEKDLLYITLSNINYDIHNSYPY
ncbi:hypothetical protein EB796_015765 [Bugula neritina]|uniref:Uncharacterized protein n=1 Tax=Bugula neritina TaxID=10212 RepID=A0A7J7JII8_BUGNE|nr:hypothetical protein EB796_015765 [Bugula neritina]